VKTKYLDNVKKYVESPNETAIEAIVGHLGLALDSHDGSLVASQDSNEVATIKTSYCSKPLDLTPKQTEQAFEAVCKKMDGDHAKCRVTCYYLLAQESDSMDRILA